MLTVTSLLGVMLGGAVGGMLRLWVGNTLARRVGAHFPWGTLAVNLTAALLLGLAFGVWQGLEASFEGLGWGIIAAGLLGGYSTVSSLSLQTLTLWPQNKRQAATYLLISVTGGIALVALGSAISQALIRVWG